MPECHAHSKDASLDITFGGYTVFNNGTAGSIHNESDKGFDVSDFNIGFISSIIVSGIVIVIIYEELHANGGSHAIISDLLMGDVDVV